MPDDINAEAQAAFAAATSTPQPMPTSGGGLPPPPPIPVMSKQEMADAAVQFMAFWTPTTVGLLGFALNREIPPGVGTLTKDEENMMRMCGASAAYPLLEKLLNKSEMIGAILFLGSYGAICYKKVSSCPKRKKLVKQDGESKPDAGADDKPDGAGPKPVGSPFKCGKGLASSLGVSPGTKLQKLDDGNYVKVSK